MLTATMNAKLKPLLLAILAALLAPADAAIKHIDKIS